MPDYLKPMRDAMYAYHVKISYIEGSKKKEKRELLDKLYSLDTRDEINEIWSFLDANILEDYIKYLLNVKKVSEDEDFFVNFPGIGNVVARLIGHFLKEGGWTDTTYLLSIADKVTMKGFIFDYPTAIGLYGDLDLIKEKILKSMYGPNGATNIHILVDWVDAVKKSKNRLDFVIKTIKEAGIFTEELLIEVTRDIVEMQEEGDEVGKEMYRLLDILSNLSDRELSIEMAKKDEESEEVIKILREL